MSVDELLDILMKDSKFSKKSVEIEFLRPRLGLGYVFEEKQLDKKLIIDAIKCKNNRKNAKINE